MKVLLLLALVAAAAAWPNFGFQSDAGGESDAQKQHDVNFLLHKIYGNIRDSDLKAKADSFDPAADLSHYSDGGEAVQKLVRDLKDDRLLQQRHWFSLFNPRQRHEALMLFDVLIHCKDWNTFVSNAAYFRQHMNEGEFVYALYVAVIHSPLTEHVVLPPLYEVTPHLFTNSEVIESAYRAKQTQKPGENFFWVHHQLTVRFDAERLSNYLDPVEELSWDKPIVQGFAPHTTYKYGGQFPSRPDNVDFEDVDGVARIRDLLIIESRIRDAIAHGYIVDKAGNHIDIMNERGIDVLGDVIESSCIALTSSTMELCTILLTLYLVDRVILMERTQGQSPSLHSGRTTFAGVSVDSVAIEGKLETYFEDFEYNLINAVDDTEQIADVDISTYVPRLNHKDFKIKVDVSNNKGEEVLATVRIFAWPHLDNNGIKFTFDEGRWNAIELDKFWVKCKYLVFCLSAILY
ncbi:hemocyanin subunit L1 [Penaeus vannamei]|uniref:Hemocyanin subunit L1 n=1 Tax=Penaeus vannamei TaxID=6689 RepID=A0A3R7LSN5_PENVA|nr:hemocyanin subunit L1 [Penaeus vannamei]